MNVQLAGLPMLPWSSPPLSHDTLAEHIMSTPVVTLKEVEQVSNIIHVLKDSSHHGYPITVDSLYSSTQSGKPTSFGALRGLILRSQLKIILKEKAFSSTPTGAASRPPICLKAFRMYYPRYPALEVNNSPLNDSRFRQSEQSLKLLCCSKSTGYDVHAGRNGSLCRSASVS